MKFTELSDEAKNKAINDYIAGWKASRGEKLPVDLTLTILLDNDEQWEYDVSGEYLDER